MRQVVLPVLLLVGACLHFAQSLSFKADGSFKIVQLTDLHLGESAAKDTGTYRVVDAVLKAEADADLVVLSGDMVSGFANRSNRTGWFANTYTPLLDRLEAAAIPHAIILGNHDAEGHLSREAIAAMDAQSLNSLTSVPPPPHTSGATNFWLDVTGAKKGSPAVRLWFLDSMDRGCAGMPGWGCVPPDTVHWVDGQAAELPRVAASAAFVHIPLPEFVRAWSRGQSTGGKGETSCCPACNTGAAAALQRAGVDAIFSGHDHDNDFDALWRGMRYAYGRKTGYGSYGPRAGTQHGARVIVVRQGEPISRAESYIRLEDGSREDQMRSQKPFWRWRQHACSMGSVLKSAMRSVPQGLEHRGVAVTIGPLGTCTAEVAHTRLPGAAKSVHIV